MPVFREVQLRILHRTCGSWIKLHLTMVRKRSLLTAMLAMAGALGVVMVGAPNAQASEVAYLLNVTVRPGYNFANAEQALSYGRGICGKISAGESYASLVADIKGDFDTSDEYQASYLISQAAQELCPDLMWQLRNSAAGYRPAEPVGPQFPQCPPGQKYWPACQ